MTASFLNMAEQFNVILNTTAAESASSNGMVERQNDILEKLKNFKKLILDINNKHINVVTAWAVKWKNSLHNCYGYFAHTNSYLAIAQV